MMREDYQRIHTIYEPYVYIIMVHDNENIRPFIHSVCATRERAETLCKRLNESFKDKKEECFADFISEEVIQ